MALLQLAITFLCKQMNEDLGFLPKSAFVASLESCLNLMMLVVLHHWSVSLFRHLFPLM